MIWIHSSSHWRISAGSLTCTTPRRRSYWRVAAGATAAGRSNGCCNWVTSRPGSSRRPPPDIIFFDPFSFKSDSSLWTLAAFRELASVCGPKQVELFTYTNSTSVRAAMLAAGFHIARGRGTGPKSETTIGLSPAAAAAQHPHELLGAEWLAKWRRSGAQAPHGSVPGDTSWHAAVSGHPQFAKEGRSLRG